MCTCNPDASKIFHEMSQKFMITFEWKSIFMGKCNFNIVIIAKSISSNQFKFGLNIFFVKRQKWYVSLFKTTLCEKVIC